ncbi:hypothetical protein CS542_07470 [Pedobacter sp. IW39]|nr:hypothetical protein CS542_07470 [Pedobacter sp. IW39]
MASDRHEPKVISRYYSARRCNALLQKASPDIQTFYCCPSSSNNAGYVGIEHYLGMIGRMMVLFSESRTHTLPGDGSASNAPPTRRQHSSRTTIILLCDI